MISKKITHFDWIQCVPTTTDRVIARGNIKSQPTKVWSINTKYRFDKIICVYKFICVPIQNNKVLV